VAHLLVDWSDGPFDGGRWFLRPTDVPVAPDELAMLLAEAAREPLRLHVAPTVATYHDGERPAVAIRWDGGTPVAATWRAEHGNRTSGWRSPPTRRPDPPRSRWTRRSLGLYRGPPGRGEGRHCLTGFWVDPCCSLEDDLTFDSARCGGGRRA
jgi:hypothetical protein